MIKSIRAELAIYLSIAMVCIIGLLSFLSYQSTADELGELYDANLQHLAETLLNNNQIDTLIGRHADAGVSPNRPAKSHIGGEQDYLIQILNQGQLVYQSHQRDFEVNTASLGLSTQWVGKKRWQVFIAKQGSITCIVAQDLKLRQRTIREVAIHLIIPQLLIVPLLIMGMLLVIGKTFKPLLSLSAALDARPADALAPLAVEQQPAELKPIIQALNRWMHKVSHTIAMQKRFTSDAAHELRTPVTALKLQISAMQHGDKSALDHCLQQAQSGIARMERLVHQLLTLAKVDPEARRQEMQSFALTPLVVKVLNDLKPLYTKKQLDIGFTRADEVTMTGLPDEIEVLLNNIIVNAIHYTPAQGVINLSLTAFEGGLRFEVEDSGPGIAPEALEKVFDRFYRAELSEGTGSGLGLAIVKEIALKHQATVHLMNKPANTGLVVIFEQKVIHR
ncbi:ATP-binding protein [Methylophilus sp. 5]|uniref:ATP-binding protein n=1 Tax=Methylophilus sp. 5 TaxID=1112274 RepID=UPI0004B4E936|nr:ATP-binding protein [Methylophilus sp. 5]